jgi:hypothetical protein
MEISKLFYRGDPDGVDNFPLVEVRCCALPMTHKFSRLTPAFPDVLLPELCVVWCDYSYHVIIGHHKVADVTVTVDMELFDVSVVPLLCWKSMTAVHS